ncbi:MAG: hypothetical protein HZA50_04520 [Planctomycetes bacterium]|nr:hypothetical protein [Planctomycetota bacterium]
MPKIENAFAGIVLTAQSFNPSIFTETWLARHGIVSADTLTGVRVFSSEVAQFQTSSVQVFIVPPKMQITFNIHGDSDDFTLPLKIAKRTIELLPHTPFQGLGLNFDFFVAQPVGQDFNSFDRDLLGTGDYRLLQEFSVPDAKFGRYFSKNYGESRLKLDIKPVQTGPDQKDMLQFSFNYHYEISQYSTDDRTRRLIQMVEPWGTLRNYAQQVVELGTTK